MTAKKPIHKPQPWWMKALIAALVAIGGSLAGAAEHAWQDWQDAPLKHYIDSTHDAKVEQRLKVLEEHDFPRVKVEDNE